MTIDDKSHYGATLLTPSMQVRDNYIYFAGVPADVTFHGDLLPVKSSFVGGLTQIKINQQLVVDYEDNL